MIFQQSMKECATLRNTSFVVSRIGQDADVSSSLAPYNEDRILEQFCSEVRPTVTQIVALQQVVLRETFEFINRK